MFYLIGVNHEAQRHLPSAKLDEDQSKLERCLVEAIEQFHPILIAVEESEETLIERKKGACVTYESIPRNVAMRHRIQPMLFEPSEDYKSKHGYLDESMIVLELFTAGLFRYVPSSQQRVAAMALQIAVFFPIREKCWIEMLQNYLELDVVVVLGENHIESFGRRLQALGVPVKVLYRQIGVTDTQLAECSAAQRFPIDNPALFRKMREQFTGSNQADGPAIVI
jgi:hypothetical protein